MSHLDKRVTILFLLKSTLNALIGTLFLSPIFVLLAIPAAAYVLLTGNVDTMSYIIKSSFQLYIGFAILYIFMWTYLTYAQYTYSLTDKTLVIKHGVIKKTRVSIAHSTVIKATIEHGPLGEVLDIVELHIKTSSKEADTQRIIKLPGLTEKTAQHIRASLIK